MFGFLLFLIQMWPVSGNPLNGVFPPEIRTVAIVSPAAPPDSEKFDRGIALLERAGLKVKVMPHARQWQDSGYSRQVPPEDRAADFEQAWLDPEVDLIWCSRGGDWSERLLPILNWEKLATRPDMPVLGFSNITSLYMGMLAKGIGHPYAGPSLTSMVTTDQDSLRFLHDVLAGKRPAPVKLTPLRKGSCSGLPVAGHLMLQERVVTKYPDFRPSTVDKIIFIENIGRSIAVWSKTLDSLYKAGYFEGCAGVVFCEFVSCGSTEEVDEVLRNFTKKVKCPVWSGFPFGHLRRNYTIDMRRRAEISEDGLLVFE